MALPQADGRAAPKRHGTICANRPLVWTLSQVRSTAPVNTPAISRPICFARSRARGIHKLWHVLGGAYNLPHAETHTVIMPYAMAYDLSAEAVVMSTIANALRTNEAAIGLYDLVGWLGAKQTLRELGMPESGIEKVAVLATQNPSGIREGLSMSRSVNFSGAPGRRAAEPVLNFRYTQYAFSHMAFPPSFFARKKAPVTPQATLARGRSIKVAGTPSTALGSAKSNVMVANGRFTPRSRSSAASVWRVTSGMSSSRVAKAKSS
jgi:Iron-containing alcohol dehydrogenase